MGLDMYLNAKRFLWYSEDDLAAKVAEVFPEIKGKRVKEVIVEAMYWRKANAIHAWFVKNCQEGEDDCGNYYVGREQLEELRQLILKALAEKDATLLPPTSGFFFGSDKVDQYYWDDLESTAKGIEEILEQFPIEHWEFEYHSSW
jgi:hypothetical protein